MLGKYNSRNWIKEMLEFIVRAATSIFLLWLAGAWIESWEIKEAGFVANIGRGFAFMFFGMIILFIFVSIWGKEVEIREKSEGAIK